MNRTDWIGIPILSPRHLLEFTPAEYKAHVCSLYSKPVPKERKALTPYVWRLNKKGTLCLRVNRKPKWLSREEIDAIAKESKLPANEVWAKVTAKKSKIKISTAEAEELIKTAIKEIPW